MTKKHRIKKQIVTRYAPLLLLTAGSGALLAGCGGGGGNGNPGGGTTGTTAGNTSGNTSGNTGTQGTSSVTGKVTDVQGNGLPGVSIAVDGGGTVTQTLGTGAYRLSGLSASAVHTITATVTQNSVVYSGSTQVFTDAAGYLVSNTNLLLSRTDQQATVSGTVTDGNGTPLSGVRVSLAVPNTTQTGGTGQFSSLIAFTGTNGTYQISNVPSNLPTGSLTLTATLTNAVNSTATLSSLSAGVTYSQNFTLSGATAQAAYTPSILGINAFTQPTDALSGSARQAHVAAASVYEGLRRRLSPLYAKNATRKRSLGKRRHGHDTGIYAVETDIAFNAPTTPDPNLYQYYIYRTVGDGVAPAQTSADSYDSLLDPQANYYTDVTFTSDTASSDPYTAGTAYNFAMSSDSTYADTQNPTGIESALSSPYYTIVPLGPLTLNAPTVGQTTSSPVTLSWAPVSGATAYYVFVYTQYPTIDTTPIYQTGVDSPLPAGTSRTSVVLSPGTYYYIVVATADEVETLGAAPQLGAAQSDSQITRFVVQ